MRYFGRVSATLSIVLLGNTLAAQEVVLLDGKRLKGTVEKYHNGLAYIRLVQDDGSTMLTSLPESAIDKVGSEKAQDPTLPEPIQVIKDVATPDTPPTGQEAQPSLTALATEEKRRKRSLRETGGAPARVLTDEDFANRAPTSEEVKAIADVGDVPPASSTADDSQSDGMKYYEDRLNTLVSGFASLGNEWEDLWLQCSPVTYDETSEHSGNAYGTRLGTAEGAYATTTGEAGLYAGRYQENVYQSYHGTTHKSGTIDRWTAACTSKYNSILTRGREIVEAYDAVYRAYESYAVNTLQVSRMMYRQLPSHVN